MGDCACHCGCRHFGHATEFESRNLRGFLLNTLAPINFGLVQFGLVSPLFLPCGSAGHLIMARLQIQMFRRK